MALQARAEATRQRILDSAVELFEEVGYGETGLADVLMRANVSKGAFYYHFDSKRAIATAIIEDYRRRVADALRQRVGAAGPTLDGLILATFVSTELLRSDKHARVGNQLLQALSHVSGAASQVYGEWTTQFVGAFVTGVEQVGVRDGVDAADTAEAAWASVLGSNLLYSALNSEPFTRLTRAWGSIIRATLPDQLLADYTTLVERRAAQFRPAG